MTKDSPLTSDEITLILVNLDRGKSRIAYGEPYPTMKEDIAEYERVMEKMQLIRKNINSDITFEPINTLKDLDEVGPQKPVGYLSIMDIHNLKEDENKLAKDFQDKGLCTRIFKEGEGSTINGALYVYDKEALQKLLNANKEVLEDAKWPTEADKFIEIIETGESAPKKTKLFNLIADAFADKINPGRL